MIENYWNEDEEKLPYENVNWYWDEKFNQLLYKSKAPETVCKTAVKTGILGSLGFRQDIELKEQLRFKRRFQRKYDTNDVVTLQDIKDVVLFTAPLKILSPAIIGMLHLPATERLIRALIMYCQYYLQVVDIMSLRKAESQCKIRTPHSDKIEAVYKENLADLRLLISKEYYSFLTGAGKYSKYHHMSGAQPAPSLGKREQMLFETFVRIVIQIIWIALGRKYFTEIEIEVHRLFKSEIYNIAEHNAKNKSTECWRDINSSDISFLTSHCTPTKQNVKLKSPLLNEMLCQGEIDYRMFGLGIFKYPRMNDRLRYFEMALVTPEENLKKNCISLGILGACRTGFDIMLNVVPPSTHRASRLSNRSASLRRLLSNYYQTPSAHSSKHRKTPSQLYTNIYLPAKELIDLPTELSFNIEFMPKKPIDKVQRSKWMHKVKQKHKLKESCNGPYNRA